MHESAGAHWSTKRYLNMTLIGKDTGESLTARSDRPPLSGVPKFLGTTASDRISGFSIKADIAEFGSYFAI
jgi:hypothetical protein